MIFAGSNREALRERYRSAWQRHEQRLPLEPLDAQIVDVLLEHPEYHAAVRSAAQTLRDFPVEHGMANPFLHMGMHLALREQTVTDRPAGIKTLHRQLSQRLGSTHDAEHRMMEALAEALWSAQRSGLAPDETAYLERLRRL